MRSSLIPLLLELSELSSFYYPRPTSLQGYNVHQGTSITKEGFQINLDVQHYFPNEISVKTVDNEIIIEGKHEERKDEEGSIARQFTRRVALPFGFDIKETVSSLSSDGILTVKVPRKPDSQEDIHHIQIQQTGPARDNVNKEENKSKESTVEDTADGGNKVEETTSGTLKQKEK